MGKLYNKNHIKGGFIHEETNEKSCNTVSRRCNSNVNSRRTLGPLPLLGFDKDKIVKVRALDDGHEVPISNAWMHSDYPDIAFVDLGPDPVLPDPVDYVLEVEMAE